MSGYNRLFADIVIHIVPNRHTGEQGMYSDKINNKGDYPSGSDPDLEIRGGARGFEKNFLSPSGLSLL